MILWPEILCGRFGDEIDENPAGTAGEALAAARAIRHQAATVIGRDGLHTRFEAGGSDEPSSPRAPENSGARDYLLTLFGFDR